MEPVTWVVAGLIAGWLAGTMMKGSGYGLVGDLLVGITGAIVGVWLFDLIVPADQRDGLAGSTLVAAIGAVVFVVLARLLTRRAVRA